MDEAGTNDASRVDSPVYSVENLTRGAVAVEVESADGTPTAGDVQQRLEQVSGVSRVLSRESRDGLLAFEVESLQGRRIRPDLARAVVSAGWNLNELRAGLSLEDIYLQLTSAENKVEPIAVPVLPMEQV